MAKANMVLPDGTKVTVEGNAEEVSALLDRFSGTASGLGPRKSRKWQKPQTASEGKPVKAKRAGPMEYIRVLKTAGFFKTKRTIAEVRDKLEEGAHIYQVTSLSAPLYRLVKRRELRRVKEDRVWKYVNP